MRTYSEPVPLSRQEVFALEAEQDERLPPRHAAGFETFDRHILDLWVRQSPEL